jgi:hypothetical protein
MAKLNNTRKPDHHRLLRGGAALLILLQVIDACTTVQVGPTPPIVAIGVVFASLFVLAEVIELLDGGARLTRRVIRKALRALRRHQSSREKSATAAK